MAPDRSNKSQPLQVTASLSTIFLMNRQQADKRRLGLPAERSVRGAQLGFEGFSITPKTGTSPTVFTSMVAP